jgi:hypothetical protein
VQRSRARDSGSFYNRVVAGDARIVFAGLYYVESQLGGSWTRRGAGVHADPIWKLEFDRTGRAWGFNYQLNGVAPDFETDAGFVNRRAVVSGRALNRFTWYGADRGALERITVFLGPNRVWRYDDFGRNGASEGTDFANASFRLRGDWELGLRASRDFVDIDGTTFSAYTVMLPAGPQPYSPLERVSGPAVEVSVRTPTYQAFDANAAVSTGRVAIFSEGSAGAQRSVGGSISLRPSASVRIGAGAAYQRIERVVDGSEYARTILPRLRAEFQPTRAFFIRGIAEYRAERRSALRAAATGYPLAINGVPVAGVDTNSLRVDFLASYRPTPGTVAFFGYGASLNEPDSFGFRDLTRSSDGLFMKLAYQLRR